MLITRARAVMATSRYHLSLIEALDPIKDKCIVIVPEQYTLQAERDLLKALHCEGLFHIEVMSFKRLWHQWAKHLGIGEGKVLSELGRKMILRQVLQDVDEKLVRYRGNYKNKGFISELSDLVSRLRQNGLPVELIEAMSRGPELSDSFKLKLSELSLIYRAYNNRLSEQVSDESFWIEKVIQGIRSSVVTVPSESRMLYVVEGFSSMTQQEIDLLCSLRAHASNMAVRIVDRNSDEVCGRYPKRLYRQLIQRMTSEGWTVTTEEDTALETPSASYFRESFEGAVTFLSNDVVLLNALDRSHELEWVFYQMVKRHHEGTPWESMAILTSQPDSYAMLAKRYSEDFGVPCFIDVKRPATGHYAIDFVMSSMRAIESHYRPDAVLKVLKAGLILPNKDLWQLENFAISKGIRGRLWLEDWIALGANTELEASRKKFMSILETLRTQTSKQHTLREKVSVLRAYLVNVGLFEGLASQVLELKDKGDYERAEEMAQIHNIIDHVLYQIFLLGEGQNLSNYDFIALLQLGFDSYEIGIIPPFQHYVTLGNIQRTRLQDLELLFFVGIVEGELPSKTAVKGLLTDQEVEWLVDQGAAALGASGDPYDEEVYKTYEHLLHVKGCVYWSYPCATTEGLPLKPSLWLNQMCPEEYRPIRANVTLADLFEQGLQRPYLNKALNLLAAHHTGDLENRMTDLEYMEALKGLKGIVESDGTGEYYQAVSGFFAGVAYTNSIPSLPQHVVSKLYGQQIKSSVTRLESFSRCPYQHFVTYGLKPQIRESQELSGIDLGDLFHGVFEGVLDQLKDLPSQASLEGWESIFEQVFESVCEGNHRFIYSPKNQYFSLRLKSVVKRALGMAIEHMSSSGFKNQKNEFAFGVGLSADAPALQIETDRGSAVLLEGKVDRIDAYFGEENCFVSVVDYKSSQQSLKLSDIFHGLKLQLMLYLEVATANGQLLFGKVTKPFGAFYYKIDEPILDANNPEKALVKAFKWEGLCLENQEIIGALDPTLHEDGQSQVLKVKKNKDGSLKKDATLLGEEDLKITLEYTKEKARDIANAIFEGAIDIAPVNHGKMPACTYCQYRPICHFDPKKRRQHYRRPEALSSEEALKKMQEVVLCRGPQSK